MSDIEMPGEDGYQLAARALARARDRGTRLNTIAVTAYARTEDRLRALEHGFNWHLAKPVEPSELVSVIASLVYAPAGGVPPELSASTSTSVRMRAIRRSTQADRRRSAICYTKIAPALPSEVLVRACVRAVAIALLSVMSASAAHAQSSRPTVAILNFDYGTIEHWWSGNQDIGQGISDLLVDELVNDGSYRVIERKRLDAILAEQNFAQSERADPSAKTLAAVGKVLGVKYMIVGSVTKFGTEKSNKSFGAGGFGSRYGIGEMGTSKGKANVAISARMIDTTTGEILAVAKGRRHLQAQRAAARRRRGRGRRRRRRPDRVRGVRVPRHHSRRGDRDGGQGDRREARRRQVAAPVVRVRGARVVRPVRLLLPRYPLVSFPDPTHPPSATARRALPRRFSLRQYLFGDSRPFGRERRYVSRD